MVHAPDTALPQTLEAFLAWEPPVDGFKYEWNDGQLIQFEKMNKKHLALIRLLGRLFATTNAYRQGGELIAEQEVRLTARQMRRPDLAYFSGEQIDGSQTEDYEPIPDFVIEVVSPNDDAEAVEQKLAEYFKAGVQVVWHIYPGNQAVYVYTSRRHVTICIEDDACTAAPVLPDFAIRVSELFATPASE
jgi:Uma2 family endonuclease